jgi:hypothetical protein
MEIRQLFYSVYEVAGIFILWVMIHFIASNLHHRFCTELTFTGFINSIFVAQTPYCIAFRWIIYNGGLAINNMWISIAFWLTTKIFKKIVLNE